MSSHFTHLRMITKPYPLFHWLFLFRQLMFLKANKDPSFSRQHAFQEVVFLGVQLLLEQQNA